MLYRDVLFSFINLIHVTMEHEFQHELQLMEQRLTDMEEKINSIDTKLTQVVDAILGNPLTKAGGFINDIEILKGKISKLEASTEKHEEFKKRISWTVGLILGIALIAQYVINVYTNLKH